MIQTGRVNPKKTAQPVVDPAVEAETDKSNESHKMSFDVRIENLYKLIQLLATYTAYAPNETELTVAALTSLYDNMLVKNQAAIDTEIPLKNARDVRFTVFYNPETGLVVKGNDSKSYIKSAFGARSTQYLQISKLKFRVYKG